MKFLLHIDDVITAHSGEVHCAVRRLYRPTAFA